jgi:hypothetical protein
MSLIVITASLCGGIAGEWKRAGTTPVFWMASGVIVLIVAIFVLGLSSRMV